MKRSTKKPTQMAFPLHGMPVHWSPKQALAVLECLQAMRETLLSMYGPKVQQAWRDQLVPPPDPTSLDPDAPF